jgi:PST family polysaccharide transporter
MTPSAAAAESTLTRAASAYRTTLLSHALRLLCKIAGVVVLARLVSPADHGLFAMAASVTFFLTLFRDFGTSGAAIQASALSEGQMTALFRLHLLLGLALAGLTLVFAPIAAAFFHEARLVPLLATMSIAPVLIGAGSWPRTLLMRELHFREVNRLETAGAVAGTIAMMAAGMLGAGAYAFVVFLIVSEAIMVFGAWRYCPWRPRGPADWPGIRPLARTGLQLTGYHLLLYGVQQADTLLMGRWFGAVALGLYNRAGQLLIQPATHLAAPFNQVLLSTLSRLGAHSPSFANHFRGTTNVIAHLTLPVAIVCLVLPHEVVRLVLGAAWPEAAPLLAWLAVNAALSLLSSSTYALCVASGHSARLAPMAGVTLLVTVIALWLGRGQGPVGLAAALAVGNLVLFIPRLWWSAAGTAVSLRDFAATFAGPLVISTALAGGLFAGRALASHAGVVPRTLIAIAGGLATTALCVLVWPRVRRELVQLGQSLAGGSHPTGRND